VKKDEPKVGGASRKNLATENIEAEECRESKVYKIKHVLDHREGRYSG
jgi:hypothetical protein